VQKPNIEARRKQLIKLIHVGRRELGMQDDDYRAMLANIPQLEGATSSAKLPIPKLKLVLETLKAKGFKVVPKGRTPQRKLADDPQSKLIRHLWLSLHSAGKVRDSSEKALNSYVARLTKVDQLQWLDRKQAATVIESLKSWLER
jgi:phage gp16-like protein